MKNFKVICQVDKNTGNGIEEYPIFVKAENDEEAERSAKYYFLTGKGSEHGWGYYGAKKVTAI